MIARIPMRVLSPYVLPRVLSRASLQCSNRSECLLLLPQRKFSTPTINPTFADPTRPQAPIQPTPKRSLRPYIYATIFALLGAVSASYVNMVIAPPPLPLPGTHEDALMVEYLSKKAKELPLVNSLSEDPNWTHQDAYGGTSSTAEERAHRLSTGPLGGARGLGGFRRIFHNENTGEHISVVWIGGALAGWPGVTHGGVTATLMDETLGLCAVRQFPGRTGVTANLELNYLKPIVTNAFYVIRANPQKGGASETKQWVDGRLETLDGRVCVEAKGLFVVPKRFKTKPISNA